MLSERVTRRFATSWSTGPTMITGTLSRYFGFAFLRALIGVFLGVFLLVL